jgi:hypothetical protein
MVHRGKRSSRQKAALLTQEQPPEQFQHLHEQAQKPAYEPSEARPVAVHAPSGSSTLPPPPLALDAQRELAQAEQQLAAARRWRGALGQLTEALDATLDGDEVAKRMVSAACIGAAASSAGCCWRRNRRGRCTCGP